MKTTINGKEYTTFKEGKTITELGIDPTRKFIVCDVGTTFNIGDIVVLDRDDDTRAPYFKRVGDGEVCCKSLCRLAYYDEHKFKVGDRVRIVNKKDSGHGVPTKEYPDLNFKKPETFNGVVGTITSLNSLMKKYPYYISDKYGNYITYCGDEEIELVEDKIIKERDGIKVGDKVEYEHEGKTYYGYVAVIKDIDSPYLLRLEGFSGHSSTWYWDEDWYPESEKKDEHNCYWLDKGQFKVVNEGKALTKPYYMTNLTESIQHMDYSSDNGTWLTIDMEKQLLTNLIKPTGNKFMSNVIKFAKELVLSKEEKLLRKYGLKNECGEYTVTAQELVIDKLVKENEAYLIEIAQKMSEEED